MYPQALLPAPKSWAAVIEPETAPTALESTIGKEADTEHGVVVLNWLKEGAVYAVFVHDEFPVSNVHGAVSECAIVLYAPVLRMLKPATAVCTAVVPKYVHM